MIQPATSHLWNTRTATAHSTAGCQMPLQPIYYTLTPIHTAPHCRTLLHTTTHRDIPRHSTTHGSTIPQARYYALLLVTAYRSLKLTAGCCSILYVPLVQQPHAYRLKLPCQAFFTSNGALTARPSSLARAWPGVDHRRWSRPYTCREVFLSNGPRERYDIDSVLYIAHVWSSDAEVGRKLQDDELQDHFYCTHRFCANTKVGGKVDKTGTV